MSRIDHTTEDTDNAQDPADQRHAGTVQPMAQPTTEPLYTVYISYGGGPAEVVASGLSFHEARMEAVDCRCKNVRSPFGGVEVWFNTEDRTLDESAPDEKGA